MHLGVLVATALVWLPALISATCRLDSFSESDITEAVSVMGRVASCSALPKLCAAGCGTRDPAQVRANEMLVDRFYFALQNQSCWGDVLMPSGYNIPTQAGTSQLVSGCIL
jgi:hypothetical protein